MYNFQGSVESCSGGLTKPVSNGHPKCRTTTGCNRTEIQDAA